MLGACINDFTGNWICSPPHSHLFLCLLKANCYNVRVAPSQQCAMPNRENLSLANSGDNIKH